MTAVNLQDDVALSSLARGLVGSEILKIAGEIRTLVERGRDICNLTVGDFALVVSFLGYLAQTTGAFGEFLGKFRQTEVSIDRLLTLSRAESGQGAGKSVLNFAIIRINRCPVGAAASPISGTMQSSAGSGTA